MSLSVQGQRPATAERTGGSLNLTSRSRTVTKHHHPDGRPIRMDQGLTVDIDDLMDALFRPKTHPWVEAWLDFTTAARKNTFVDLLRQIYKMSTKSNDGERMTTTYMEDISRDIKARYLGPDVPPGEAASLQAGYIFLPSRINAVTDWIVHASDRQRDAFKDCFLALTKYYKDRKEPRSDFQANFKCKDPDFRARNKQAKVMEKRTKLMKEHENDDHDWTVFDDVAPLDETQPSIKPAVSHPEGYDIPSDRPHNPDEHANRSPSQDHGEGGFHDQGVQTGYGDDNVDSASTHSQKASARGDDASKTVTIAKNPRLKGTRSSLLKPEDQEDRVSEPKIQKKYAEFLRSRALAALPHWLKAANIDHKLKFEEVMYFIRKRITKRPATRGKSPPPSSANPNWQTTSEKANVDATKGFHNTRGQVMEPHEFCRLYAGSIIKEDYWPQVALFLRDGNQQDRDKFRDAFGSFTHFYKAIKGSRSMYHDTFKQTSPSKKKAFAKAEETIRASTHRPSSAARQFYQEQAARPSSARSTASSRAGSTLKHEHFIRGMERTASRQSSRASSARGSARSQQQQQQQQEGPQITRQFQQEWKPPERKHGGFFGKSSYQVAMNWKTRPPSATGKVIKEKNLATHNPLGAMFASGPSHFTTSYGKTFQGKQGAQMGKIDNKLF